MKTSLCLYCANRTVIKRISDTGHTYTDYICSVSGTQIKSLDKCPEDYDFEEYEELLEKGDKYDLLRYAAELQAALC